MRRPDPLAAAVEAMGRGRIDPLAGILGLRPLGRAPGTRTPVRVASVRLARARASLWALRVGSNDEDRARRRRHAVTRVLARLALGDLALVLLLPKERGAAELIHVRRTATGTPVAVHVAFSPGAPKSSQRDLLKRIRLTPGEDAGRAQARLRAAFDPELPARAAARATVALRARHDPRTLVASLGRCFEARPNGRSCRGALADVHGALASWHLSREEGDPHDASWDPDPSLLARVHHALREPRERSALGAFDTPDALARHLCRRVIESYLAERAGVGPDAMAAVYRTEREGRVRAPDALRTAAIAIRRALASFTVCDPAAGTGALLVRMLRELACLREGVAWILGEEVTLASRAAWRYDFVARALHGIEADPRALEVCAARIALAAQAADRRLSPRPHLAALDVLLGGAWPGDFPRAFDAVVANPPYVRQERLGPAAKRRLAKRFAQVYRGTADLHVFFCARAAELLRPGGHLAIVTNGKFLRAAYGEGLRAHLARSLSLAEVIDLGDLPVFDAAAYPVLLVGRRKPPGARHALRALEAGPVLRRRIRIAGLRVRSSEVRAILEDLEGVMRVDGIAAFPQALLCEREWVIERPERMALARRLRAAGQPLRAVAGGGMFRGVVTGLNEAFVIDEAARSRILSENPAAGQLIRPWIRGRDVCSWHVRPSGLFVIFTRHGTDLSRLPAVVAHLARFRERLTPRSKRNGSGDDGVGRKPGSYRWFEIQDEIAYHAAFASPKIVFSKFVTRPCFAWDESSAITSNATAILPGAPRWLVALLQSDVLWFLLRGRLTRLQNGYFQLMNANVLDLPIVAPVPGDRRVLERIVAEIQEGVSPAEVQDLEARSEAIVRRTYGLDRRESRLLEDWAREERGAPEVTPNQGAAAPPAPCRSGAGSRSPEPTTRSRPPT